MADQKVNELSTTTPALTDYIMGMSGTAEYKALVSAVAKKIVEDYAGSTLAGSAQSVKSALDALNSTLGAIKSESLYLAAATTITRTLDVGQYLVTVGRLNSAAGEGNGMYLITAHGTTSSILTLASSGYATVSINKRVLTVTTSQAYCVASITKLCGIS